MEHFQEYKILKIVTENYGDTDLKILAAELSKIKKNGKILSIFKPYSVNISDSTLYVFDINSEIAKQIMSNPNEIVTLDKNWFNLLSADVKGFNGVKYSCGYYHWELLNSIDEHKRLTKQREATNNEVNDDSPIEALVFWMLKELITASYDIDPINEINSFFEILIFSTCCAVRHFLIVRPELANSFVQAIFKTIQEFAGKNSMAERISCDYLDFIKNRIKLYNNEIESIYKYEVDNSVYVPGKLVYYFYDKPLTMQDGFNADMVKHLELWAIIPHHLKAINDWIDKVVELKTT